MLFTIRDILKKNQVKEEDSIYAEDPEPVKNFVVSSGDFFSVIRDRKSLPLHADHEKLPASPQCDDVGRPFAGQGPDVLCQQNDEAGKSFVSQRLEAIRQRLKALKNDEEDITHAHADEIKALRMEKKQLMALSAQNSERGDEKSIILFKNCLCAASFQTVKKYIPQMSGVNFRYVEDMPLFIKNPDRLGAVAASGAPLAVCGGPCLFGVGEVLVNVALWDGSLLTYDFSSGRHFMSNGDQRDLTQDLMEFGTDVKGIDFVNQKLGVTTQEYDSIHCLFEVAAALGARLAIPLPDMSYIKFFSNIVAPVPKRIAEDAILRFRNEAYKISDMYLEIIRLLQLEYPQVETVVVHERNQQLCRIYYEQREAFLTPTVVKRLTAVRGKTDAVLDYITMPALPYYLWGIRDIIQMDSLDETDSYRKCCRIHKGVVNLYAMMYPERLSGDGKNTIFYAPMRFKEYL